MQTPRRPKLNRPRKQLLSFIKLPLFNRTLPFLPQSEGFQIPLGVELGPTYLRQHEGGACGGAAVADDGSRRDHGEVGPGAAAAEAAAGGDGDRRRSEGGEDVEDRSRALAVAAAVDANPNF